MGEESQPAHQLNLRGHAYLRRGLRALAGFPGNAVAGFKFKVHPNPFLCPGTRDAYNSNGW